MKNNENIKKRKKEKQAKGRNQAKIQVRFCFYFCLKILLDNNYFFQ